MDPRELRIGNLVKIEGFFSIHFEGGVFPITANGIFQFSKGKLSFDPVPITEDWITRGGWKWNEECKSYEHKDHIRMSLKYVDVSNSYTMYNHVLQALIAKRIFYVHQLQNLYFALTGEELVFRSNETKLYQV